MGASGVIRGPQGGVGGFGSALVASGRNQHVQRPRAAPGSSGERVTRPAASGRTGKPRAAGVRI